jgi:hypothetical protein
MAVEVKISGTSLLRRLVRDDSSFPKLLGRLLMAGIRSPGRPVLEHDICYDYNR